MPNERADEARRIMIGSPMSWVKSFNVSEYINNPPMIEKLWEEKQMAFTENLDLKAQLKRIEARIHLLELDNQKLGFKASESDKKIFIVFSLSLIATLLTGLGINLATSNSKDFTGWALIILGAVIEVVSFLFSRGGRN